MTHLEIVNPATGQVVDEILSDSNQSTLAKFQTAQDTQKLWRKSAVQYRLDCALRFKSLLLSQIELLAKDLTLETGKPISQSRGEISAVTSRIDFFVEATPAVLANQKVSREGAGIDEIIEQEPLGVIANISAWNYPYFVGLNVIVPALLAGNGVLYKPSECALLTGLHISRLLEEAGFPKHLIAPIVGGAPQGEFLLSLPINGLFFTGSFSTGQKILNSFGSRMARTQLELGGKDGIYICEDANVDFAAPSVAEGAFYNTGQGCCSVERLFVHEKIYDHFMKTLISEVSSYALGDPADDKTFLGPLIRPQQVTHLQEQVDDAVLHGSKIVLGGNRVERPGSYFAPTIIECGNSDCKILRDESFGPIVAIQQVSSDAEAIQKLNNSQYGLTAGVYSPNKDRAIDILREVQVGSAYWNCCDRVSPYLPWTGRKSSGVGVTLGTEGIRSFTQSKAWHLRQEPDAKK